MAMEKLAHDLRKRFLHLVEAITTCKTAKENGDGEEADLKSMKKQGVQDRGIGVTRGSRGPRRPGVPKGAPPQTHKRPTI
ncbi:hypothetical protein PVL29_027038 [Vitis rotundifolia]|uniref:Uncharacterized protein n=1 Tax=Vitis rotundifolia TaxID=103349 RepID=A0AA39D5M9_VITRO|nr:hypothetical protein PVL29_027038 [Vitis rotundifolia]